MVGSQQAARTASGVAVAKGSDRLRRFFFAAALIGPVFLAACGSPFAPQATVTPKPQPGAAVAEPPPEPQIGAVAPHVPELGKLAGLGEAELVAMLGQPDFRRNDPPAEIWQYRSADCVLDIFLYSEAGGYRVVHSEAHDRHVLPPTIGPCEDVGAFADRARQSPL